MKINRAVPVVLISDRVAEKYLHLDQKRICCHLMKDPESEKLIKATEKCIRESESLIRDLRANILTERKYRADILRVIEELNLVLKPEIQKDDPN